MIGYNPTWLFVNGVPFDPEVGSLSLNDGLIISIQPAFLTNYLFGSLVSAALGTIDYLIVNETTGTVLLDTQDTEGSAIYNHPVLVTEIGLIHFTITFTKQYTTTTLTEVIDITIPAQGNVTVLKDACSKYKVTLDSAITTSVNVAIEQVGTDYTAGYIIDNDVLTTEPNEVTISLPGDGVYIITTTSPELGETKYVIYEFCKITACFKKYMLAIYCDKTDCGCDTPTKRYELQKKRFELNLVKTMFDEMNNLAKRDALFYLNLNLIDDVRFTDLSVLSSLLLGLGKKLDLYCSCLDKGSNIPCTQCH